MAVTPEGKVKAKVKEALIKYGCYYFMPVNQGLGAAGLDFHCVVKFGLFPIAFFIETKAPGKKLTPRQSALAEKLSLMGAYVFIIEDELGVAKLTVWLKMITNYQGQQYEYPHTVASDPVPISQ